eukprot:COSAG02_NODE_776_length_17302_cov_17.765855_2_plen_73_part_00
MALPGRGGAWLACCSIIYLLVVLQTRIGLTGRDGGGGRRGGGGGGGGGGVGAGGGGGARGWGVVYSRVRAVL